MSADQPDPLHEHRRTLAGSPFPGDAGSANPVTRDLMVLAPLDPPGSYLRAIAALCGDRLLVPVVATATRLGEVRDGLVSDKEAEMSVVFLQAADGSRATVAFTGLDTLQVWRADARPVPVTLDLLARTALAERTVALIVDVSGTAPLVIEGEVLAALADGHRLVELQDGGFGWARTSP